MALDKSWTPKKCYGPNHHHHEVPPLQGRPLTYAAMVLEEEMKKKKNPPHPLQLCSEKGTFCLHTRGSDSLNDQIHYMS
jgi:hypothetical protein